MHGTMPWPKLTPIEAVQKHCNGERLLPPQGRLSDAALSGIMQQCWAQLVTERLSMAAVRDKLTTRLGELRQAPAAAATPPKPPVPRRPEVSSSIESKASMPRSLSETKGGDETAVLAVAAVVAPSPSEPPRRAPSQQLAKSAVAESASGANGESHEQQERADDESGGLGGDDKGAAAAAASGADRATRQQQKAKQYSECDGLAAERALITEQKDSAASAPPLAPPEATPADATIASPSPAPM